MANKPWRLPDQAPVAKSVALLGGSISRQCFKRESLYL